MFVLPIGIYKSISNLYISMLASFVCFQGVIRDEQDLDMLGSQFKSAYSKREVDPFDDRGSNSKK